MGDRSHPLHPFIHHIEHLLCVRHLQCTFMVIVMAMVTLLNVEFVIHKGGEWELTFRVVFLINHCFTAMCSVVSRDSCNSPRASAKGLRELQSSEDSALSRHPSSK